MVKVHGMSASGNCHKVRMVLEALALPYQWTEVAMRGGATRTAAFLAMNPNGKVPVAEVEPGVFLPESNAIMCYLADGTERCELVAHRIVVEQYRREGLRRRPA